MPRHSSWTATAVVLFAVGALLAGCTAAAPRPAPSPSASVLGAFGQPGCLPPSPIVPGIGAPETQGTARDGASLYARLMTTGPIPLAVSPARVTLAVRMTGSGDIAVTLLDPSGSQRRLDFGPEFTSDSTYARPGQAWRVGATFDRPGCWQLHFERSGSGVADLWLGVLP